MGTDRIPIAIYFTISLLGFWLIASTITFGAESAPLIWTNFLCGFLLIVLGLKGRSHPKSLHTWTLAAIGGWLQFSPLLFWAPQAASYVNDTFVGCWIIALALLLHPMPGHTFSTPPTIPPGWSYNPSSWAQRLPIAFLAFLCWMIARYLSAYQLGYIDTVWDPFFSPGTQSVLESDVSKAFPVSDAGLGAFAYTLEFFSACQGSTNRWRTAPWLVLVFGILVIPVSIVSTILIILQPLAVGTWCTLCLITALLMLMSIPLAIGEVAATLQFLRHSHSKPFFTLLFHGGESPHEQIDRLSPPMDRPLLTLLKASLSGVSFPFNLVLCSIFGIALMALPSILRVTGLSYDLDPILGALVTITSVIAFSEYARLARWLNLPLALILFITALSTPGHFLLHATIAVAILILTPRKGPIRERFHYEPK